MNEKERINSDVKYESADASAKWLGAIGAAIVVAAIILPFLLWGLYGHLEQTAAKGAPIPEAESRKRFDQPNAPRLEPQPVENYQKFRQTENEKLNGYGWIDEQKGIVHIPIEQAMKVLANKGLPNVNQANQTQNAADSNSMPSNPQPINGSAEGVNGRQK